MPVPCQYLISSGLCLQVLDAFVVHQELGNSSAKVPPSYFRCAVAKQSMIWQQGDSIDWGAALTHLAERAVRQVFSLVCVYGPFLKPR